MSENHGLIMLDNPLEFTLAYVVMKLHAILEKLNNIYVVVDLKWQHEQTLDSFFEST